MWTILELPPQPFGECSFCKRHTCGEYKDEDGVTRQKWLHTPLEMDKGGNLVIGYQCVQTMSDELAITKKTVEKIVPIPATDEHILAFIRRTMDVATQELAEKQPVTRDELKAWLNERNISFFKGATDDQLRELVAKHQEAV